MRNLSKLAALTLVAFVLLPGLRAFASKPDDIESFVRAFAADHMSDAHVPGMVFVYADADGIAYSEAFGLAEVATERPMTLETPLRVGSISKPITAALAFELAASGEIDMDSPVDVYVDRALGDAYGEASTIRRLLQHLGGYPDAFVGSHHPDGDQALTLDEWTRNLPDRSTAPGVVASYSSVGYTLAGAAMEQAAGVSFSELAETRLFDQVGMPSASFSQKPPIDIAIGYSWTGAYEPYPLDSPDLVPGAGLVASATDIGHFMSALLNTNGPLDSTTRDGLLTRVGPQPGLRGYTTGLIEWIYDTRSVLYHEGNGIGTSNRMIILPDEGVAFYTAVNAEAMVGQGDPSSQNQFMRTLQEEVIARFYPGPWSLGEGTADDEAGVPTDDIAGTYLPTRIDTGSPLRLEALVSQFDVSPVDDGVAFGSSTYRQVRTGEYRSEGSGVSFREAEDGVVYATRGGHASYRKAASWELMGPNAVFLAGTVLALVVAAIVSIRRMHGHLRWLMVGVAGLGLAFIASLGYGLVTIEAMDLFTGLPPAIVIAQLAVAGTLVLGTAAVSSAVAGVLRGSLERNALIWSLLTGAGAVGLFGWAWMWSVLPV